MRCGSAQGQAVSLERPTSRAAFLVRRGRCFSDSNRSAPPCCGWRSAYQPRAGMPHRAFAACRSAAAGVWRNGSASDSRSEGWEFESLCPHSVRAASHFVPLAVLAVVRFAVVPGRAAAGASALAASSCGFALRHARHPWSSGRIHRCHRCDCAWRCLASLAFGPAPLRRVYAGILKP